MNIRKHCITLITILFGLSCLTAAQAFAALTAQLDRERVTEGETVRLTIEASGRITAMPDTRALEQDFEITGTMSGSRVNIINGNMDSRTTWTISLVPRRSGRLTIPSLSIDGDVTPELTLQVVEAGAQSEPDSTTPVFLETEVDTTDPYVQGMVRYTQRVFFAVNLAQGSLSEPEHENVLVQKLGEDREYLAQRNGRSYNVIEREFVIFPQISGSLVIPAPVLNAQIPENTNRHDPFFDRFFSSTRPVRLRGEAITLNVRPRPNQSKSPYWLPAESVELHETWQPQDDTIAFGDPVTRNITISALGVTGEQLPELKLADPAGFKLYPDRTQSNTQNLPHNIRGEKTLRLAYMPTQPGTHTLPAFTLHWWDTRTDSEQTATLPARTIKVLPAADQPHNAATPAALAKAGEITSAQSTRQDSANPFSPDSGAGSNRAASAINHAGWFWTSLLFAALWLITLGLWWRKRHSAPRMIATKKASDPEPENSRNARKGFLEACRTNDAKRARHDLLKWAALHWPESPPAGLEVLASRLNDPAIKTALMKLDRVLYQHTGKHWNGQELAQLLTELPQHSRNTGNSKHDSALPDLYT